MSLYCAFFSWHSLSAYLHSNFSSLHVSSPETFGSHCFEFWQITMASLHSEEAYVDAQLDSANDIAKFNIQNMIQNRMERLFI